MSMAPRLLLSRIGATAGLLLLTSCVRQAPQWHLQRAEEFSRQGRYDEAIAEYRAHIEQRRTFSKRPAWENPWFYLVLIGDLSLAKGDVDGALRAFEEAEKQGVEAILVSDRFRYVARWYEREGNLAKALEVLRTYRERDPMLFDLISDRIAKELLLREEQGSVSAAMPPPAPSVSPTSSVPPMLSPVPR